jgi:integrase
MPRPRADKPTYSLSERGGWWYVQWWDGNSGVARRISCRTQKQVEARRFLAEFRVSSDAPSLPASPTIGEILDGYEADRSRSQHSPSLAYDVATLKRHLEHLPAHLMNAKQSEEYWHKRRTEPARTASAKYRVRPKPLSDGTLIRELGVLRAALSWAVRERWIPSAPDVRRPSAPPARDRWLTREEYKRLLGSAKAHHVRLFIALAVYTGARMGALLELTWDRVDMQARRIDLGEGRGRKRRATVPIIDELYAELVTAREIATTGFVIEHGGRPVATVKTGIRAAAKRAQIEGVTPHVFRHTAATWMVQRSTPFPMVASWLGNSVAVVEKVYGHHSPEWLKQAAEALSSPMAERTKSLDREKV